MDREEALEFIISQLNDKQTEADAEDIRKIREAIRVVENDFEKLATLEKIRRNKSEKKPTSLEALDEIASYPVSLGYDTDMWGNEVSCGSISIYQMYEDEVDLIEKDLKAFGLPIDVIVKALKDGVCLYVDRHKRHKCDLVWAAGEHHLRVIDNDGPIYLSSWNYGMGWTLASEDLKNE